MEVIITEQVPQYPELSRCERRTVLGLSTDAGYSTYYVMLDERFRGGTAARVVAVPFGCCDISDGCLPPSWSLDQQLLAIEGRTVMHIGPHGWVAHWSAWMERLAVGDEDTLAEAWEHAQCHRLADEP